MATSKGQIILTGLFDVLEFFQKQTNEFVIVVKTNPIVFSRSLLSLKLECVILYPIHSQCSTTFGAKVKGQLQQSLESNIEKSSNTDIVFLWFSKVLCLKNDN